MKIFPLLVTLLAFTLPAQGQDTVLARNQWTVVTKSDFDAEMARIPTAQHFSFLSSAERVARLVEIILFNKTLAAQARAAKLDEQPAIKAEILNQTERVLARHQQERMEAALKEPNFTRRAEELYKADKPKYVEKGLYHTAHVLVDTKCRSLEAAKERAMEARRELLAGAPFPDVVKKYSDDPTAPDNKGDLGPLYLEGLAIDYANAVRGMKKGDISEPVATQFGIHVILLVDVKPGRQLTFNEVREGIVAELKEDWLKQQKRSITESVTADPKLKLELDAIQALKTSIPSTAPAAAPPILPSAPPVPPAFTTKPKE